FTIQFCHFVGRIFFGIHERRYQSDLSRPKAALVYSPAEFTHYHLRGQCVICGAIKPLRVELRLFPRHAMIGHTKSTSAPEITMPRSIHAKHYVHPTLAQRRNVAVGIEQAVTEQNIPRIQGSKHITKQTGFTGFLAAHWCHYQIQCCATRVGKDYNQPGDWKAHAIHLIASRWICVAVFRRIGHQDSGAIDNLYRTSFPQPIHRSCVLYSPCDDSHQRANQLQWQTSTSFAIAARVGRTTLASVSRSPHHYPSHCIATRLIGGDNLREKCPDGNNWSEDAIAKLYVELLQQRAYRFGIQQLTERKSLGLVKLTSALIQIRRFATMSHPGLLAMWRPEELRRF